MIHPASERLTQTESDQLRAIFAAARTEKVVAKQFRLDRLTLLKAAAGLALSHGSVVTIRAALAGAPQPSQMPDHQASE